MASIADLFFAFRGDDKQLVVDAAKAGDKAGKTLGDRLGLSFSKTGATLGALGGLALALGDKYAAATNTLIRETGAAGDELEQLKGVMSTVAGQVPQGIDQVGLAVARVHTQLGLEGDALAKTSKLALDYARVNRIDVAAAVGLVDDALDRLGLGAENAAPLLDKVTVAGQKAGVASQDLLVGLATAGPTLRNLGFGLDDSIALLAQYTGAGGDAADLTGALNKAVVKFAAEGATNGREALDLLNAKIKEAPDNLTAVTIASEIFGSKIGASLVPSIRDGTFNLDELTGALHDSDGAFEDNAERTKTWGDRFSEVLNGVGAAIGPVVGSLGEFGFAAAGIGRAIPIVTGAVGALAPKLIRPFAEAAPRIAAVLADGLARLGPSLATTFMGLPGSAAVTAAADKAGALLGDRLGTAIKFSLLAAAIPVILDLWQQYQDLVNANKSQLNDIGKSIAEEIATGTAEALVKAKSALEAAIKQLEPRGRGGSVAPVELAELRKQLDLVNAEIDRRNATGSSVQVGVEVGPANPAEIQRGVDEVLNGASGAIRHGGHRVVDEMARVLSLTISQIVESTPDARLAMAKFLLDAAAGIRDTRSAITAALDQLKTDMEHSLSPKKEVAQRIGELFGRTLSKGLRSADPVVKAQAEGTRGLIEAQLIETIKAGGKAGTKIQEELERKLHSKDPAVKAQAQRTKAVIDAALKAQPPKTPGDKIAQDLASDLKTGSGPAYVAAYNLGVGIARNILAGVKGSGVKSGPSGGGGGGGGDDHVGLGGYAQGTNYVPYDMFAQIHRGEIIVPADDSNRIRAGLATLGAGSAGVAVHIGTIDARGHSSPAAVAAAVKQAIMDDVADGLRAQVARLPVGTRA